jgi:hypothetical protein
MVHLLGAEGMTVTRDDEAVGIPPGGVTEPGRARAESARLGPASMRRHLGMWRPTIETGQLDVAEYGRRCPSEIMFMVSGTGVV